MVQGATQNEDTSTARRQAAPAAVRSLLGGDRIDAGTGLGWRGLALLDLRLRALDRRARVLADELGGVRSNALCDAESIVAPMAWWST